MSDHQFIPFEEGAGVLEVLFGVGLGGGEARKRFVQQADDPLLVGQRGDGNLEAENVVHLSAWHSCAGTGRVDAINCFVSEKPIDQILPREFRAGFNWEDFG